MKKIPVKQTKSEDGRMITSILGGLFKQITSEYARKYYICGIKLWSNQRPELEIVRSEIGKLHFDETLGNLDQKFGQLNKEQKSALQNLNESLLYKEQVLLTSLATQKEQFSEEISVIRAEISSIHQEINKQIEQVQSQINEIKTLMMNEHNEILDKITTVKNETDEKVATLKAADEELSANLSAFKENTNRTLTDLHTTDNSLQQNLDKAKEEFAQADNNLSQNITALENKVLDLNKKSEENIVALRIKSENTSEDLQKQITTVKNETDEKVATLKADAEVLSSLLNGLKQEFADTTQALKATDTSLQEKIGSVQNALTTASNELSQKITAAENNALDLNQKSDIAVKSLQQENVALKNQSKSQYDKINQQVVATENKITELGSKLDIVNNFVRTTSVIEFNDETLPLMKYGFYSVEQWGCWLQKYAMLLIKVLNTQSDINLTFSLNCFHPEQEKNLSVYANGKMVGTYKSTQGDNTISVAISRLNIPENGFIYLEFVTDKLESPKEIHGSEDTRILGFGLSEMTSNTQIISFKLDKDLFQALYTQKHSCHFKNEEWRDYFKTHDIKQELIELKQNLPEDSQKLIDEFYVRRQNPYVFSGYEVKQHEIILVNDISKYRIANKIGFQPEVFYLRNGLKFLDENIIKRHLQDKDVIDGGACSGDSALMFSEYEYVHKIYAFEPMKESFNGLKKTLKLNHCTKAEAIHAAISDKDGKATIMDEQCETKTIDTFAKDKKIGCIKFDLEGMEGKALQGAIETIKRDKPLLLICLYHTPLDFFKIKPMINSLNLGYKFMVQDTEPCNEAIGIHLMLIAYQDI